MVREASTSTTNRMQGNRSTTEALTFNVAGLLAEPAGSVRQLSVSGPALDLEPDVVQICEVEGELRLTRTNRGLLLHGRLRNAIRADVQPLPARDRVAGRARPGRGGSGRPSIC